MKTPKKIDLSPEEYDSLQERLQKRDLQESDYTLLIGVLQFLVWLQHSLQEAKISISRLSQLFGFKKRKRKRRSSPIEYAQSSTEEEKFSELSSEEQARESSSEEASPEEPKKKAGHGRIPYSAYTGAPTIQVPLPDLQSGTPCPLGCGGFLYLIAAGHLIRVTGSPIAAATHYELEKLRCNLCGKYFTAPLPLGVHPDEKYDEPAKAALVLQKYFMGSPFHRISTFQSLIGMPIAESTIWELCEELGEVVYPVFRSLMIQGAQGKVLHNDDTSVKILSLLKENQQDPPPERKGMYTSGILAKIRTSDGIVRKVVLFISGRKHAGENLDWVLKHRSKELPPAIQMADALSSNNTKETETIRSSCLTHGFRNFEDIFDYWPDECHFVMKKISQVYEFEDHTKKNDLSDQQRLEYHQNHSKEIMKELLDWLEEQKEDLSFDPGSSLGKAIQYLLNHWDKLTQFLKIPGAPIDNNELERCFKVPKRNQKNAYFYKTEHGALIGDLHMSVIYTCWINEINPFDYLIQLQLYRSEVFKTPELFLPWNYQQTMDLLESKSA